MPTPRRISYPGAYYHVINRGNNKSVLFLDDNDRIKYLFLLRTCLKKFNLKIYAYALMSNHTHIFLKTLEANISEAMHSFNLEYTRYFNSKYRRTGHLFESRFKSKLVQKERYFLSVLRYIHLNPVKAGIASNPSDYKWSSHTDYILGNNGIVEDMGEVLIRFGKESEKAKNEYEKFINSPVPDREWAMLDKVRNGILGDPSFHNSQKVPGTF